MKRVVKENALGRCTSRRWWWLVWVLIAVPLLDVCAGVLVAPTVVFLSDRQRTGRLTIQNPTDKPKEISVYFSFGLPTSDSLGNVFVTLQDSGVTDPRSAVTWVKAFPRKVILPPHVSQVVRLVANPPADLPDGEYWARIVIRSQEGQTMVPASTEQTGITTKLNMIMQTAIMLKYRTGSLISNLELLSVEAKAEDDRVVVLADLVNRGNVSYIGILNCRLLDTAGKQVSYKRIDLAVYRSLKRRIELPFVDGDFTAPYRVELAISSEGRNDVAPENMIAGNRIEYSMAVE